MYISMLRVNNGAYNIDGDDINVDVDDDDTHYLMSIWITQIFYWCR